MMTAAALTRGERGATSVEYALLMALIAAVIITSVILFGGSVSDLFSDTANSLESGVKP